MSGRHGARAEARPSAVPSSERHAAEGPERHLGTAVSPRPREADRERHIPVCSFQTYLKHAIYS